MTLWPPSASPFLYPMPVYGEASNHRWSSPLRKYFNSLNYLRVIQNLAVWNISSDLTIFLAVLWALRSQIIQAIQGQDTWKNILKELSWTVATFFSYQKDGTPLCSVIDYHYYSLYVVHSKTSMWWHTGTQFWILRFLKKILSHL